MFSPNSAVRSRPGTPVSVERGQTRLVKRDEAHYKATCIASTRDKTPMPVNSSPETSQKKRTRPSRTAAIGQPALMPPFDYKIIPFYQPRCIAREAQCCSGYIFDCSHVRGRLLSRQDSRRNGGCGQLHTLVRLIGSSPALLPKAPVAMGPGEMLLTRILFFPSSTAAERVN